MVPHLSERPQIYTFPNPRRSSYYGPGGKNLKGNEAAVEYLIVKVDQFNDNDRAPFDQIRTSGEFEVIYDKDPLYVLHRTPT